MGLSVGEATRSASHWISLASMSSVVSVSHCFYVWGPLLCLCVFKTVKASNREHSRSIYVCTVFIPFVLLEPPLRQLSTSCSIQVCRTTAHLSAWLHSCVYVCACKDGRWGFHRRLGTVLAWADMYSCSHIQPVDSILHWSWTSAHAMSLFTSC